MDRSLRPKSRCGCSMRPRGLGLCGAKLDTVIPCSFAKSKVVLCVHVRPEVHVQMLRAYETQAVSVHAANDGVLLTRGLGLGLNEGGSDETARVSVRHDVEVAQR